MIRLAAILAALALAACVSARTADPARLPDGAWGLDAEHASVTWRVRHMGLSWYTARFDVFDATLDFDPARPESASLTAIVDAASVSTGDPDFDATLRGPGWLDAEGHPQIVFVSGRIEVTGERTGRVHGMLTLTGRTAPAVLETEFYGGVLNPLEGRQAIGFGADLVVSRSEFSIGRLPPGFLGDEVRLRIEAEFLRED